MIKTSVLNEIKSVCKEAVDLAAHRKKANKQLQGWNAELNDQIDGLQVTLDQMNKLAEEQTQDLHDYDRREEIMRETDARQTEQYVNLVRTAEGFLKMAHNGLLLGPGYKAARTNLVNALKDLKS